MWRVDRDDVRDHAADKHWILTEKEKCIQQPDRLARNKLPGEGQKEAQMEKAAHMADT